MRLIGPEMANKGSSIIVETDGFSLTVVILFAAVEKSVLEVQESTASLLHCKYETHI